MPSICFYFQVHQPYRVREYNFFEMAGDHEYFDDQKNYDILHKVSEKCYLPTNRTLKKLIEHFPNDFYFSFSLSGVFLEQIKHWHPEVLHSFQELVATGNVEILSETYYHSLSFLYSKEEFVSQVQQHAAIVKELFGVEPKVFRNTELIYNNEIARFIDSMGYKGILAEGVDWLMGYKSPNFLHHPPGMPHFPILTKNYRLSDDIAFRFSDKNWVDYPLTTGKYVNWLNRAGLNAETINLFMDYETFGEHQWEDTGIFNFLYHLPSQVLEHSQFDFKSPSQVIESYPIRGEYDVHEFTSWADSERDLSAWRENSLQHEALRRLYSLESAIKAAQDPFLLDDWKKLTTSDHFYYMSTKFWNDGDVHKYFSPFESPYDAYLNFINMCSDLEYRLSKTTFAGLMEKSLELEPDIVPENPHQDYQPRPMQD